MKIAVIGAGAMGSIYGGRLSQKNDVYLIDTNPTIVDRINAQGLTLIEKNEKLICHPKAYVCPEEIGTADLIILFVKALYSKIALTSAKDLLGKSTYVMTLQNGAGHENILEEFVENDHIIIGTTEDNGSVLEPGVVRHGGTGRTNIGLLTGNNSPILSSIKENFDSCGFDVKIYTNIQKLIWHKLFTNVSLSVLTGLLQVDMGFIATDQHAWQLACMLIHEAVAVANQMGLDFKEEAMREEVRTISLSNPTGCTSIRADLRDGRKTEVDTISGAVVMAARKIGITVPYHQMVVELVHGMENKNTYNFPLSKS